MAVAAAAAAADDDEAEGQQTEPATLSPVTALPQPLHFHKMSSQAQFYRALPVVFVVLLIGTLYTIYLTYHCLPLLQLDNPPNFYQAEYTKGLWQIITFNILAFLLLISYSLTVIVHPGTIPDTPEFSVCPIDEEGRGPTDPYSLPPSLSQTETKRTGERRHCKWCGKFKPDRAHHCRVCRTCIKKMDHHCPWIFNCVGWGNHKYFMLSIIYSVICTLFIAITMFESVRKAVEEPITPFGEMFLLLFGETLDVFLAVVMTGFFGLHCWLISIGSTTIEFCEQQFRDKQGSKRVWSRGCYNNFCDVFGPNPLLWFIPFDNRRGDGLSFVCESTRLLTDAEDRFDGGYRSSRLSQKSIRESDKAQFEPIIDS